MLPSGAKQADDAREVKRRTVVRTRRSAEGRRIVEPIDRDILLLGSPLRAGWKNDDRGCILDRKIQRASCLSVVRETHRRTSVTQRNRVRKSKQRKSQAMGTTLPTYCVAP
jgi:hypothetical protein